MHALEIEGLHKSYGSLPVLHNVNLAIADKQFVVLVGPSGCGKSTLLRMIAGLEDITKGEIKIRGRVVNRVSPRDRDIAMVFQNYALYPQKTVAENIAFGLKLRGVDRAVIDERVGRAAKTLGLQHLLERYPRQLSGGQRQRVAMGRAIVRDPQLFLFDEPLSNLDAQLRVQMRTEIKTLHLDLGTTSIYVTHDQMEAMTMADLIVVMNGGHIIQQGRPLDLYDRPTNLFVAKFIGSPSMNFLEGVLERSGKSVAFRAGDSLVQLPPKTQGQDRDRVTLGVRPEHVRIHASTGPVAGTIRLVEQTGTDSLVFVKVGESELCVLSRDRVEYTPGTDVKLSFDEHKTHLFDSDGNRIGD